MSAKSGWCARSERRRAKTDSMTVDALAAPFWWVLIVEKNAARLRIHVAVSDLRLSIGSKARRKGMV